jgi:uncharacterized iron-regulated membrane protein
VWLQPLPAGAEGPAAAHAWSRALDLGLEDVARRYPGAQVEYVNLPREADAPVTVRLLPSATNEAGAVDIDAIKGTAGALRPDSSDARMILYTLHERLLLADAGPWVLRTVVLCALVGIVLGLKVWLRVRRAPARNPWQRVHRWVGPFAVLPIAMMLVTGFALRSPEWASAFFAALPSAAAAPGGKPATAAPAPAAATATPAQAATLGQALVAASSALPDARPIRIYPARKGVVRVRMRGTEWHPLGLTSVFVNTADASVQRVVLAADQPLGVRYLNVVYPLHLGWMPGNPGVAAAIVARVFWTLIALSLAGLALSGTVYRFRPKSQTQTNPRRQVECKQNQAR